MLKKSINISKKEERGGGRSGGLCQKRNGNSEKWRDLKIPQNYHDNLLDYEEHYVTWEPDKYY